MSDLLKEEGSGLTVEKINRARDILTRPGTVLDSGILADAAYRGLITIEQAVLIKKDLPPSASTEQIIESIENILKKS